MSTEIARPGDQPEDYQRWGVRPGIVEPWEDGMRTKPNEKTFEWWYLDASFDDGSNAVLTFMTKDAFNFGIEMKPWVMLELTDAQGKTRTFRNDVQATDFSAKTDHCDVRIGASTLVGDLKRYTVHFEKDDLVANFTFDNLLKSWRPGAGANLFGAHYFAWLPSIPSGKVVATINDAGKQYTQNGSGYHDHNWGDAQMLQLMHHWY